MGSSAVLPCGLTPALNAKMFDLRWYKNDYNNPVLLYKDLKVQENPGDAQYRVSLIGELDKGNVSLRLENLTLADGGEYVCFVKSVIWYEKASVNLIVRVLGSFPLFSLAEFGDQVNVSCASAGWSPKPTLTWRDKRGRELATSHIYYKTESEWISCSVGLSDQEMVDSRVLPVKVTAMLLICIASLLICSAAASDFSVFSSNASVSERLGSSAVLPCGLSPSLNAELFKVRWHKNDYNNPVLLYEDLKIQENAGDPLYRGRVSLIGDLQKGNLSLKLENLTLADGGEYVCLVKSLTWYESVKVNLTIKELGSSPLFLMAEDGNQVNVTCRSNGWSPKPTLTWRDKGGRELTTSHIYYKTDSEGLVSVSSWLLLSPSESEWISCSVGLSDQEMKEGRVLPHKEIWREAFIATLVLSLFIVIVLTALLLFVRKGLFPHRPSHKNTKEDFPESTTEETLPLTGPGEESLRMWKKLRKDKVELTVDPETCKKPLTMAQDGGVFCGQLNKGDLSQTSPFPPALSKEGFSSGQKYWEVTVDQNEKSKKSWCVGVTQKPPTEETRTALCYKEHCGIYPSTDPHTQIPAEGHVTTLGLVLDFKHKTLSFINVDKESHLQTFRMNKMENSKYFALISPGTVDIHPVSFHS
ncbi:hypothetical protein SRHO_G00247560 [Serrasalmus rhombeus]